MTHDPAPVSVRTIVLLLAATCGGALATIVPLAYSLAVRLDQLAPGRADLLGLLLGAGAAASLVVAPLTGTVSDRTRTQWGRRRPYVVGGMAVGILASPLLAFAPDLWMLAAGWVVSTIGWGTALSAVGNWQADRLPVQQRGRVSGLTTAAMQVSPILGIVLVSPFGGDPGTMILLPATLAVLCVGVFALFVPDPDSRGMARVPFRARDLWASYVFDPREFPDFAWNWAGRFVFFLGLSLTTSFTVFFYGQRLGLAPAAVAGVLAVTSLLSLATSLLGAAGGGWLSDRIGRRRPLVLAGGLLFAAGGVVFATAWSLPAIIAGGLLVAAGMSVFSAAGQAMSLDILPHRETQAGRFMAILLFSQKIPSVISPLAAPLLLSIGGAQNFTAVYLAAAALAVAGTVIISSGVRSVR